MILHTIPLLRRGRLNRLLVEITLEFMPQLSFGTSPQTATLLRL
jgi:hypothetical protein